MIALRMVCSDEKVIVSRAYLARIGEMYRIVYPYPVSRKNRQFKEVKFTDCSYETDDNIVFSWNELHELAEIF